MTITLVDFAAGDTGYIAKFNSNFSTIETAINALQSQVAAASNVTSMSSSYYALFGTSNAVIGDNSYTYGISSSTILTFTSGYAWLPTKMTVVGNLAPPNIDFTGFTAGTYYIRLDSAGTPVASLSNDGTSIYTVVWTGSGFGTITQTANNAWGFTTWMDAQSNAALNLTLPTLDGLLEGIAGSVTQGISKALTADVTLTQTEASTNFAITCTGAQGADHNLIVPAHPKPWLVFNNCTGGHSVTVKTASGTGVATANGSVALVWCDGTNVVSGISSSPSFAAQTANTILAGPTSGGSATPTFRAIVPADLPVMVGSGASHAAGIVPDPGASAGTTKYLREDGSWQVPTGTATGTVTTVSVASANGFSGTVANASTTPAITLTTSITGILKGNATAISAATSGTDYAPGTSALATGILKSTTTTGALSIAVAGDFPTLNQNTTGSAAKLTTARSIGGVSFDGSADITQPVVIPFYYPGKPGNAALMGIIPLPIACTIPSNFTGFASIVKTNPAATWTITVKFYRGGTLQATGTFSISTSGVFTGSLASPYSAAAGDWIEIYNQATADTTGSDASFAILGTR